MQKIMFNKNKRGQVSGGLVTSLVFGIASLIIGVIVAFVIVNTLNDASLLTANSLEQNATDNMIANFTAGIDEVSAKIPTVLLVSAVVLIMGALVLLVGVWQRMKLGGGSL